MRTDFIKEIIKIKDITKDCPYELTLLENNEKQIEYIFNFFQNEKKLLLLKGFKGTGKTEICDFTISQINTGALILQYKCFETTILDDMLLAFFEIFRKYTTEGKIISPKVKAENFTQKINSYFNYIAAPIVIVINSFDAVLKSNKQDLLNFIKHLSNYPNIKIIITSRKFQEEDFADINYDTTTIIAYSKVFFEKYLKSKEIKQIGILSNELYRQSKGYYKNIKLSVEIMKLRRYNISKFLEVFSNSYMAFSDFIIREALSLVDPVSTHLFRLLAMMRIPIHINLLKSLNLYNEERTNFFINNSLLYKDGECLYIDDSIREVVEHQIPESVLQKLHRACIDLYNTQLPLKPLERDLRLSRQTMRNEIDYHSLFLPKKQSIPSNNPLEVKVPKIIQEKPKQEETKEEKIKKINFIVEDENLLENIASSIKEFVSQNIETETLTRQSQGLSLTKIINLARQEENKYNYKHAIMLYQNALTKRDDDDFLKFLPTIYTNIAKNYKNLSMWYEAIEYYTQAQDFYYNASNELKCCEVKLEIANIYYIIYKHDNAKVILNELDKNKNLPSELKIKVKLALGKLSEGNNQTYQYYKDAVELSDNTMSKSVLTELYYKYAAECDEKNDIQTAAEYYKKCIEIESSPSKNNYLSRSLAGLAELYHEAGSEDLAIKFYEESIKIDTETKNYNGLYCSSRNLSEIYSSKDAQKSLQYLKKAYESAKELNEPYYMADCAIEIGDFHMLRKNLEEAYRYFSEAYEVDKHSFNKSNLESIDAKIGAIKAMLGEEDFQKLKEKYEK